jgi:hypothetical protein
MKRAHVGALVLLSAIASAAAVDSVVDADPARRGQLPVRPKASVRTVTGSGRTPERTLLFGRSVHGRRLTARVLGPESAPRKILLVGCIHGNECAGLRIIEAIARSRPLPGVQL